MKHLILFSGLLSATLFTSCLAPMAGVAPATGSQTAATNASSATQSQAQQGYGGLNDILGNIISKVTGNATTSQATLIGSWSYIEPSVQFESENLLAQAGGAAAAQKVEAQLSNIYRMAGISEGRLSFNFARDGQVTYTLGGRSLNGSYVFNAAEKTVTITTATGMTLNAYVTVVGNNMSLCFDSTKVLTLFSSMGGQIAGTISSAAAVAQNFTGMKTGFKFMRQ